MAHRLGEVEVWLAAVVGFVAFSLCASSAYVLNDLVDREADRAHPTKRTRPFAAQTLPATWGWVAGPTLLAAGVVIAVVLLPSAFTGVLGIYVLATVAYSLVLKRLPMVDVIVLAGLYTLRLFAGGAATGIPVSHWLLAFAIFFFLSLALLKRYTELRGLEAIGGLSAPNRGYVVEDMALLRSAGPSAGIISVFVLALYVTSPEVIVLYARPTLLWLVGGLMLFWVLRAWMLAHRGEMDDDPVLFAARDGVSYVVGGLIAITLFFAAG